MRSIRNMLMLVAAVLVAGAAGAGEPVRNLQDLVGVEKGEGGYQMQQRGYTYVRSDRAGSNEWTYWREARSNRCVMVKESDNRYRIIEYVTDIDCQGQGGGDSWGGGETWDDRAHNDDERFDTVCGVIVNGQTYRYHCTLVNFYEGGRLFKTAVHFPDQNIRMVWKSNNEVVLHFEGMTPQRARYSHSEGETDVFFEDKTYFFYSDREKARREVANFRN